MTLTIPWRVQLIALIALAIGVGIAGWISAGPVAGLRGTAMMLALVALFHYGRRRFDAINVLTGSGDERTRALYNDATAFMGTVLLTVITVWWVVSGFVGGVNQTLTVLTGVGVVSLVLGAILGSRRG